MKDKFNYLKNKLKKFLNKFKYKKEIKIILENTKRLSINNLSYLFMFLSLYILDISTRISTNSIGFVKYSETIPNLFSFLWIFLLIFTVKNLKSIYGKLIYVLSFAFSFVMFLIHNIYYAYFKVFFDFSALTATSEGTSYFLDTLKDIKLWMYVIMILSIIFMLISYKTFNKNKKNNYILTSLTLILFVFGHSLLPLSFGDATTELEWNAWSNKRNIYNNFNDNNKSMQLSFLHTLYILLLIYIQTFKN